jgi:hypothetical protein
MSGSRPVTDRDRTTGRWHRWAALLLVRLLTLLTGAGRTDPACGYAALRRAAAVDPPADPAAGTHSRTNRRTAAEPIWSPGRHVAPVTDLWAAAEAKPAARAWPAGYNAAGYPAVAPGGDRPGAAGSRAGDNQSRRAGRDLTGARAAKTNSARGEVGLRRRRLETQRPDLRVINGEGTGSRRRPPRLRAIPGEG